jgi:nicotinate-nucleotide adenylyltransferase
MSKPPKSLTLCKSRLCDSKRSEGEAIQKASLLPKNSSGLTRNSKILPVSQNSRAYEKRQDQGALRASSGVDWVVNAQRSKQCNADIGVFRKSYSSFVLYGGTFDPPHKGHLYVANTVHAHFHPERFIFIPCYQHSLKTQVHSNINDRLDMLRLLLKDTPFLIDTLEIEKEDFAYTIDTLKQYRKQCGNTKSIIYIMGLDAFYTLHKWHDWQALCDYAHILVIDRPTVGSIPKAVEDFLLKHQSDIASLSQKPCGHIAFFDIDPCPYSSTDIRNRIAHGESVHAYLTNQVDKYIQTHGLYIKKQN